MKRSILIIALLLLVTVSLISKYGNYTIFILDSDNKPVGNAVVEVKNRFFGSTICLGITDKTGEIKIDALTGKYEIIVSHLKFDQLVSYIQISDKILSYEFQLIPCRSYSFVEGRFCYGYDTKYNYFSNKMFIGRPSIDFHGMVIPYSYDTTGYYIAKIPPGKYRLNFTALYCDIFKRDENLINNNKLILDFTFNHSYVNNCRGYLNFDFSLYGNILNGLHNLSGIKLIGD